MSNNSFTFNIRTQFFFVVDDRTLSRILSGIAEEGVNINGYLQTKFSFKNHNLVRLVVGSTDSESNHDIRVVRGVLIKLSVKLQEKKVIQVLEITSGVPGQVNSIFGALWCKLNVEAIYVGEDTKLYLDVLDINEAIQILSQEDPEQCLKDC
ncbi:hypothetical protein [Alteribacillus bidgolensis]|uniref:ACT domain-containing protein n=1 Tax=Alteribacillus bidgolensis TaxID=930129 RepID=A0A1G8RI51_9BACI|nr:hypothetical protein [Alteribacillus bidgolensis]SDJ16744.1 hypothetical protein SAMN05216352_1283 [Alteribacillus bidgolensis]